MEFLVYFLIGAVLGMAAMVGWLLYEFRRK